MENRSVGLVEKLVKEYYERSFSDEQSDKKYPSLDLVRLEKWHFGGAGKGRLLEYACGTGVNMLHLLECGYEVEGVDVALNALQRTRLRLENRKDLQERANLRLIDVAATSLDHENDLFDYVNCMNVLSLLGSLEKVSNLLREIHRVMKPGAKIILDINGHKSSFAQNGKPQGEDVFFYGELQMPVYCLESKEKFAEIIGQYFAIDDVGITQFSYFGNAVEEFIICAHA